MNAWLQCQVVEVQTAQLRLELLAHQAACVVSHQLIVCRVRPQVPLVTCTAEGVSAEE